MLRSPIRIALGSLLFTYAFFFEYLRPFRWVHIPFDLDVFHHPLADYAFQSLKQGRFPQWDPTTYCGMSFVANIQAALFYPPTWLMFATRLNHERLSYQSLETLVLAHVWLAFFLCYLWLRGKLLTELACILGAGVFAFSGYLCSQLQHFGIAAGYAWFPLGLWGIDQAAEQRSWRPLWKLVVASALCLLAGYPPTWFVFAVISGVYALAGSWRWKSTMGVATGLLASLALTAIQLLPTWEAIGFRVPEQRYGATRETTLLLSFLLPNYFDFAIDAPAPANPYKDYFYLGVPALFTLLMLLRLRNLRNLLPAAAVGVASVVLVTNPFRLVWVTIRYSDLLQDICRDFYFLAGVTLAFAVLTAHALDGLLRREVRPVRRWVAWASLASMGVWAAADVMRWLRLGFPAGWYTLFDALAALSLFGAGLYVIRSQHGVARMWTAAVLVLFIGVNYKVFGTSKRFNASLGGVGAQYSSASFYAMDPEAYQQMRANSHYRILLDLTGPEASRLRHVGLSTPQGYDPLLSSRFRKFMEPLADFRTERDFDVDPSNEAALRLLGVRYIISADAGPLYPKLSGSPRFRLIGSDQFFYKVFEYVDAQPPYGWDSEDAGNELELRTWTPDERMFTVRTSRGGRFRLSEQFYPGWTVSIDGRRATLERWSGAFQAVDVPAGEHTVVFRFRQRWLGVGAGISLVALSGLVFWVRHARNYALPRGATRAADA